MFSLNALRIFVKLLIVYTLILCAALTTRAIMAFDRGAWFNGVMLLLIASISTWHLANWMVRNAPSLKE